MQRKSGTLKKVFVRRPAGWFGAFLISLLLGTAPGCSTATPPQGSEVKPAITVLRVACPGEPTATVVQRYGRGWAGRDRSLEIVRYEPALGPEAAPPADLWIVPTAEMPHWAAAGKLQVIPDRLAKESAGYDWDRLIPLYKSKLLIWDQKVFALPVLGDGRVCCYRKDLLEDEGNQAAFQARFHRKLAAPATWEEYAELAEFFNKRMRTGLAATCPSLPALSADDADLDYEFYAVASPFARRAVHEGEGHEPPTNETFSFHYDLATGAVRIDTAGFVHALELLQRLQVCRPPGAVAEPLGAFEKGDAALCLATAPWLSRFARSAAVKNKFGICRVPGSSHIYDFTTGKQIGIAGNNDVPYLGAGGWVGVVPVSNSEPEAAFTLLTFLSNPKTSLEIAIEPDWGGGVYRRTHFDDQAGWTALGLGAQTRVLVECLRQTATHPQLKDPVLRLRIPEERSHRQAVDAALRSALLNGKNAKLALSEAAARWRELDAQQDAKTRRDYYRLSLSLTLTE
jgi:ABC-type glycerol-3-phosphate transport system substrate-binding protein